MSKIGQKDKRTNNDLQNAPQKTKDRATQTGGEFVCSEKVCSACSTYGTVVLLLLQYKSCMKKDPDYDHEKRNISVVICGTDIQ
jgi:hypothetical protein